MVCCFQVQEIIQWNDSGTHTFAGLNPEATYEFKVCRMTTDGESNVCMFRMFQPMATDENDSLKDSGDNPRIEPNTISFK